MTSTIRILLIAGMAAALGACSSSGDDSASDAGDTDTHSSMDAGPDASADGGDTDTGSALDTDTFSDLPCPDLDAGFNEATPGYQMFLDIGSVTMMGQKIGTGVGGFWNTGREDFDPVPAPALALDECKLDDAAAPVPECALNGDDCPPDQDCVQDTDSNGNPIAGTEHCETLRTMIDVGPFTMYGFADGPKTFASNAANSGAYMATADGSIPATSFAYDATYSFYGLGDLAAGVGAFWGDLYIGPDTQLTKPAVSSASGIPVIKVNPNDDLEIEWSGPAAGGELTITLVGAKLSGQSASVTCRVADDGAFTIPADLVNASGLGALALLNTLMLERRGVGRVCGEGLTSGAVSTVQTYMVNVQKTGGASTDAGVDGGN